MKMFIVRYWRQDGEKGYFVRFAGSERALRKKERFRRDFPNVKYKILHVPLREETARLFAGLKAITAEQQNPNLTIESILSSLIHTAVELLSKS